MSIFNYLNKEIKDIQPYEPGKPISLVAKELGLSYDSISKLASNECPLGISPLATEAIKNSAEQMNLYPEGGCFELKNKLGDAYQLQPDQFVIGNGSNEILEFIAHCFLNKDSSAVMSKHAFVIYKILSKMFGAEIIESPMTADYRHDLTAMYKSIKENTKVVFICNPNNPTSTIVNEAELAAFMKDVPENVLTVVDEAYAEITFKKMPNAIKYINEGKNVIVLRSFSKTYGLAGLRIGYGITTPELAFALNKPRQPFNVNRMAQIAAAAALDDNEFLERCKHLYQKGAEQIIDACKEIGLEYIPPYTNFMLIKVGDSKKIFDKLLKKGVIVRPMGGYELPEWIRVSIGTQEDNEKFISAIKQVI